MGPKLMVRGGYRWRYPLDSLDVGDSFYWPIENRDGSYSWRKHNNVRTSAYQYGRRRGMKISVVQEMFDDRLHAKVTRSA